MALKKITTTGSGHTSEYFKILSWSVDFSNSDLVEIVFGLFKDKTTADAGLSHEEHLEIVTCDKKQEFTLAYLYSLAREQSIILKDAENV